MQDVALQKKSRLALRVFIPKPEKRLSPHSPAWGSVSIIWQQPFGKSLFLLLFLKSWKNRVEEVSYLGGGEIVFEDHKVIEDAGAVLVFILSTAEVELVAGHDPLAELLGLCQLTVDVQCRGSGRSAPGEGDEVPAVFQYSGEPVANSWISLRFCEQAPPTYLPTRARTLESSRPSIPNHHTHRSYPRSCCNCNLPWACTTPR